MFGKRLSRALAVTTVASLVMATAALADVATDVDLDINGGDMYTNTLNATLDLHFTHCPPGGDMDAVGIAFSNVALANTAVGWSAEQAWTGDNCASGLPPTGSESYNWTLAAGADGTRTLYARIRHGNDYTQVTDAIVYDASAPSVDITSPADGSSTSDASITVSGAVSDATSGVASVDVNGIPATLSGNPTSGFSAATVSLDCGANTITATATDNATNQAQDSVRVTRICGPTYTIAGFYNPVANRQDNGGVVNGAKAGSTIPLKFNIYDGTTVIDETSAVTALIQRTPCASGSEVDLLTAAELSSGNTSLRWDGTQFIFNWKTDKSFANGCYRVIVSATGGASVSADFQFTR